MAARLAIAYTHLAYRRKVWTVQSNAPVKSRVPGANPETESATENYRPATQWADKGENVR